MRQHVAAPRLSHQPIRVFLDPGRLTAGVTGCFAEMQQFMKKVALSGDGVIIDIS